MSIKRLFFIILLGWLPALLCCGPAQAGTMLDKGDCYSGCTIVSDTSLSCTSSTCVGYGGYHLGENATGFFSDSIYNSECRYYNGTAWLDCVRKRYDGATLSWVQDGHSLAQRDRALLEPVYLLLLNAVPDGSTFRPALPDPEPLPSAIDNSAGHSCYNTVVDKLYYSYTQGVNAYPVRLSCNDGGTWTGDRLFYISPAMGRAALATLLAAKIDTDPAHKLLVGMTSYTAGSFLLSITKSTTSCSGGCITPVDCGDGVINCDACTGVPCP